MFLSLGGSRRASSSGVPRVQVNQVLQNFKQEDKRSLPEDPLQALASNEYAVFRSSSSINSTLPETFQSCCQDPTRISSSNASAPYITSQGAYSPSQSFATSGSSMSPPHEPYSPCLSSLSRESGTIHGVPGGEELLSTRYLRLKQAETLRPSPTIALAKKLRHSLGDKFADSLRGMIDVVEKKEVNDDDISLEGVPGAIAWSEQLQPLDEQIATSGVGIAQKFWDKCSEFEKNTAIIHTDAVIETNRENSFVFHAEQRSKNSEDFASLRSRKSLKRSLCESENHTTAMGWSAQKSFSQSREAMAPEPTCKSDSEQILDAPRYPWSAGISTQIFYTSPNSSMNTGLYTPTHSSSLEYNCGNVNLIREPCKEPGSKERWRDRLTMPRQPSARSTATRKHLFPEAAAMGIFPSIQPREDPFRAVTEGRSKPSASPRSTSRSLLGFQNSSSASKPTPQFSTDRETLHQFSVANPSCYVPVRNVVTNSWQESFDAAREGPVNSYNLSGYGYCSGDGGVKETHGSDSSVNEQSIGQCIDTNSILNLLLPIENEIGTESDSMALASIENFLSDISTVGARDLYPSTSDLLDDFTEVESLVPPHASL